MYEFQTCRFKVQITWVILDRKKMSVINRTPLIRVSWLFQGIYKSPANLSPRQAWPGIGCCFKYFITNPDRLALILILSVVSDYTSISPISFELKTYRLYLVNGTPESEICGRWKERKSGSIWLLYLHDIGDFPGCFVTKVRPIDKKFSSRKNKAVPLGLISCHKWTYWIPAIL